MAQLTEQLGMVQRGRETLEPVRPAPSLFEALAGVASTGLEMHQGASQVRTRRAAAERQAREDAIAEGERMAENEAAASIIDVLRPSETDPATARALVAARDEANHLGPLSAAVNQGRQTRDSMELRIEMRLRDLIARHPNAAGVIVQTFRENGLVSPLMREYEEAREDLDSERDNLREIREEELQTAAELGFQITPTMSPAEVEDVLASVRRHREAIATLGAEEQRLRITTAQNNISEQDRRRAEDTFSRNILVTGQELMSTELHGIQLAITQLVESGLPDAEITTRLGSLMGQVQSAANLRRQEFLTRYGADMTSDDRTQFNQMVDTYINQMRELTIGDNSIVQQRMRQLSLITTNLRISQTTALPFITQLRSLTGNDEVVQQLLRTIVSNPEVTARISRELNGFANLATSDQGERDARTRVNNVARLLRDANVNIQDYGPTEARRMITDHIVPAVQGLLRNPDVQSGRNAGAHASAVIGIQHLANAAVEAVPQWGVGNLSGLLHNTLTNQGVWNALFATNVNPTDRRMVIDSWFPAVQQTIQALREAPTNDPYHEVYWNQRGNGGRGIWQWRRTSTPIPRESDTSLARASFGRPRPGPTQQTLDKMNALNRGTNFLSNASAQGHDRAVPVQGINFAERRRFYAQGIPPAAMRQQEDTSARVRSAEENLSNLERNVGNWINRLPGVPPRNELEPIEGGNDHTATLNQRVRAAEADPQRAPHVEAARSWAEQNGAPPDAITRLFAQESGYDNSARAGSGDREAIGVGQVTVRTARAYGVSRAQLEAMTPQQNMSLAFRILQDNFEATGNWQDAISMYHSGVSLAEARRQRRHDGNMSTSDYVEGILGG